MMGVSFFGFHYLKKVSFDAMPWFVDQTLATVLLYCRECLVPEELYH